MIESIIEKSGTPYFSFEDIDENKPTGSIKIRVETIRYARLRRARARRTGVIRVCSDRHLAAVA